MNLDRMATRLDALKERVVAQQAAQHAVDELEREVSEARQVRYNPEALADFWLRMHVKYDHPGKYSWQCWPEALFAEQQAQLRSMSNEELDQWEAILLARQGSDEP